MSETITRDRSGLELLPEAQPLRAGCHEQDLSRVRAASAALARSHSWPVLVNLANEGGSAEGWWEIADAVNGGGTLPGGSRLDRTYAANTGCNRFWPAGSIPPDASLP